MKLNFTLFAMAMLLSVSSVFAQGTCATAIPLTPGVQQCGDTTEGGDTFDDNACLGTYDGGDDYLFVITIPAGNDGDALNLDLTSAGSWTGIAISEGCPEGGAGACFGSSTSSSGNESFQSALLTGGMTYYIHISTWPSPQSAVFCLDVAFETPPPPPANDLCANAIPLIPEPSAVGACVPTNVNSSFFAATHTSTAGFCTSGSGTSAPDLWFSVVVPASGEVTIQTSGDADTVMEIFEGTCDGLISLDCDDDGGVGTSSLSSFTGLVPGTILFARVWEFNGDEDDETFGICASTIEAALPLDLVNFSGRNLADKNILTWNTANENNVSHFNIESSSDGQVDWKKIGEVAAKGGVNQSYTFNGDSPTSIRYYRLEAVDFDQRITMSNTVLLERKSDKFELTSVYPQPARGQIMVKFESNASTTTQLEIINPIGQNVKNIKANTQVGMNAVNVDITSIGTGLYILKLTQNEQIITTKILLN